MAMVIGKHRVPVHSMSVTDENGEFNCHQMVYVCQIAHGAPSWLWSCLGYDGISRYKPKRTVPLFQEILDALGEKRRKRRRGLYYDSNGKLMSSMVTMTVRGRNFLMLNNMRYLCLNLGDSLELMNWFLAQMRADLANPREEEVADPSEFEDLAKVGAPFKKRKKTQESTTQDTPVQNLVKKALEGLKRDTSVKRASFDMCLGKFRVVLTSNKIM